jgi:hypothetical protein
MLMRSVLTAALIAICVLCFGFIKIRGLIRSS